MKRILILILMAGACLAQTTVSDTIRVPIGNALFTGKVSISAPTMTIGTTVYSAWRQDYQVTAGTFTVSLMPNPEGYSYTVAYSPTRGNGWTERWIVPTSATAVTIASIRTSTTPTPQTTITPSQITAGGASEDQCLVYNGTAWAPGSCAEAGGGDVSGPASSVADNFVGFSGTTGKVLKDSGSKASDFATAGHNHSGTYTPLNGTGASGTWGISVSGNAATVTNGVYTTGAGSVFLAPNGSAAALTNFPTLNQNTTGTAAALTANGANCSAGYSPLGVDASGAAESCWQVTPAAIGAAASNASTTVNGETCALGGTCTIPASMVYPGSGIPASTGSAWGTSYTAVTTLGSPGANTNIPTEAAVRAAISAAGGGDVSGPASSVDGRIATFSGTSGKLLQDGGVAISGLATAAHNHDATYLGLHSKADTSGNADTVTNGVYTTGAGTVFLAPNGSAASLTNFPTLNQSTSGNAATATALAANGSNCTTGQAALGVTAAGAAEGCWSVTAAAISAEPALGNPASDNYVLQSTAAGVRSWVAQAGGHTQNTDTATTSDTFQIDSGNSGPLWHNESGAMAARNAANSAYAEVIASAFSTPAGTAFLASGAEQAAPTTTTPTLFFDSTAHLPQYKNAADTLVGTMVAPAASRTANQFATHVSTAGVVTTAAIAAADLPAALANSTSINGTSIAASKTILYTDSAAGSFPTLNQSTSGNAATATALAANGTNCTSGQAALGVDASGAAEGCWSPAPTADPVFTSSVQLPNGTGPTVDAAGEAAVDTTTDQFQFYGAAKRALPSVQSKGFTLMAPVDTDDIPVFIAPYGMTILSIKGILTGTTNVVGQLQECDTAGANCADLDSDITFNGGVDADDGSLTDSGIASGAVLMWKTTSVSGTPTSLHVTFTYRVVPD